ncbi:c-type cytochrome [Rhodoferax sp.]|uniref:c-type cytochrome n=1 Tax=Rhodoferax sp. TaxID=50421 RepID=UPI003782D33F
MKQFIRSIAAGALGLACGFAQADALQVRSLAASCSACHGTNGVAQPGMESLAGKSKDDLLTKLLDYKTGKKPATLMHQLAKGYTDEQLEQMAGYFAALKK